MNLNSLMNGDIFHRMLYKTLSFFHGVCYVKLCNSARTVHLNTIVTSVLICGAPLYSAFTVNQILYITCQEL